MKQTILVLSCEHAVNTIPQQYIHLFNNQESILTTYLAVDLGALDITKHLSQQLSCKYFNPTISRLLIDCNQDTTHDRCFSKYTKECNSEIKNELINQYHQPFRKQIQDHIQSIINQNKQVLHISVHSFHNTCDTENTAIGLLYDSNRHGEREVARIWRGLLDNQHPTYRVRINHPNEGMTTNFPSTLRNTYKECDYLGIVLEINQCLINQLEWEQQLIHVIHTTLFELMQLL